VFRQRCKEDSHAQLSERDERIAQEIRYRSSPIVSEKKGGSEAGSALHPRGGNTRAGHRVNALIERREEGPEDHNFEGKGELCLWEKKKRKSTLNEKP